MLECQFCINAERKYMRKNDTRTLSCFCSYYSLRIMAYLGNVQSVEQKKIKFIFFFAIFFLHDTKIIVIFAKIKRFHFTSMERFHIIGIRILHGCNKTIRRVLRENTTYFFIKGYKVSKSDNLFIERIEPNQKSEDCSIYDVNGKSHHRVSVSVSAIVGKNGDGKSTLIEIMMRILFSLANVQNEIDKELKAVLYFKINQTIFSLVCKDEKIECWENGTPLQDLEKVKGFFYTLIINYSLYAYNTSLMESNSSEYIKNMYLNLFHEEDLKTIPLLIHPTRNEKSIIEVSNLIKLANSRLLAIFTQSEKTRNNDDSNIAIGFAFKVNNLARDVFSNPINRLIEITFDSNQQNEKKTNYTSLLYLVDEDGPVIGCPLGVQDSLQLFESIDSILKDNKVIFELIIYLIKHNDSMKDQLQRLSNYYSDSFTNEDINESFDIEIIIFLVVLIKVWKYSINDCLIKSLKPNKALKKMNSPNPELTALESSALFVYSQILSEESFIDAFKSLLSLESIKEILNSEFIDSSEAFKSLKETITGIMEKGINNNIHDFALCVNFLKKKNEKLFHEKEWDGHYDHFISFDKLYEKIKGKKNEISLNEIANNMPSSRVFEGEIIFSKKAQFGNTKDKFGSSEMSSGELQLLSTISSIVYYIRSIDKDVHWEDSSQYRHINLILEEIELYYHPEYQRIFLYRLLQNIQNIELERIESINIIFVTHSPFILSDISQNNILFLKEGRDCGNEITVNPFAANVNEILSQSFFLDNGFMGELAKRKIKSLITFLKDLKRKGDNYWNETTTLTFIEQIGEPLLFHNLIDLYTKKYYGNSNELIQWHINQIKRLRNKNKE